MYRAYPELAVKSSILDWQDGNWRQASTAWIPQYSKSLSVHSYTSLYVHHTDDSNSRVSDQYSRNQRQDRCTGLVFRQRVLGALLLDSQPTSHSSLRSNLPCFNIRLLCSFLHFTTRFAFWPSNPLRPFQLSWRNQPQT